MKGDIFINSVQVPDKHLSFTEGRIESRKERRTINNTLTSDVIETKKTFSFSFDRDSVWVDGNYVRDMITLYESAEDVTLEITEADETVSEYTCSMKMDVELIREWKYDNFAYNGFEFVLEQV